jgi:hypothetical protein
MNAQVNEIEELAIDLACARQAMEIEGMLAWLRQERRAERRGQIANCKLQIANWEGAGEMVPIKVIREETGQGERFVKNLKAFMQAAGLKRRHLAIAAGVSPAAVTKWFHGAIPRADTLNRIARVLRVRGEDFF